MNELILNIELEAIWKALEGYRLSCIPEGKPENDNEWSEICTQMAWIEEFLENEGV